MILQYILLAFILALCIGYASWRIYDTIKKNLRCRNYGCAGCAFYEKCTKTRKK